MKDYLLTLITAALVATLVMLLAPQGEGGGTAKHLKLLTSLFLVCVLISPLRGAAEGLRALINGELSLEWEESVGEESQDRLQQTLTGASKQYFAEMLTQALEERFSIATGEVRCLVEWSEERDSPRPTHVTVLLSGRAIWKDPQAIGDYVTGLLDCPCATAIE